VPPTPSKAPVISLPVLAFFRRIVRGYFRRHFRAVRVFGADYLRAAGTGPVIVFGSHSSWWDPMSLILLAEQLLPARRHFAPMEARALERYGILKRIGIFGVDLGGGLAENRPVGSARGAAQFLRTSLAILTEGGVLWMTPQGRFADPRERPLIFKPGLAALAARVPGPCTLIPLALEYPFWDERLPECLLLFGDPILIQPGQSAEALEPILHASLLAAMDSLAAKAIARDPASFELLANGSAGTGGFYQFGQRLWHRLWGKPFQAEHTAFPRPTAAAPPVPEVASPSSRSCAPDTAEEHPE
jgi:1-acyl-sn-glycerol-3-phosphate acyltransferase